MSLDVSIDSDGATFAARPAYGKPVTFVVESREINVSRSGYWYAKRVAPRFVVALKGSSGDGFSHHTSFDEACKRALSRARRYEKAYSQPRGVVAAERLERAS